MDTLKAYYRKLNNIRKGFWYQQSCLITVLCLILSLFISNVSVYSHEIPDHSSHVSGKHRIFPPDKYGAIRRVGSDSPGTLWVAWSRVSDPQQPSISHYTLEIKPAGTSWGRGNLNVGYHTVNAPTSSKKITGLVPGASYDVRVRTHPVPTANPDDPAETNHWMESTWAYASGTTQPPRPDAPTITVTANSTTELGVRWTAGATNGATVAGFRIEWRALWSNEGWTGSDAEATDTETTLTGLQPYTTYEVRVRATVETGTSYTDSDWATARGTTQVPKPDAPTVTVTTNSTTALTVRWTAGADNGATVSGFRIEWRAPGLGGQWFGSLDPDATDTERTITGLQPGTTYEVRVKTRVSSGGRDSDWATATGTTSQPRPP